MKVTPYAIGVLTLLSGSAAMAITDSNVRRTGGTGSRPIIEVDNELIAASVYRKRNGPPYPPTRFNKLDFATF